jgi:PleD family two-component response regulator
MFSMTVNDFLLTMATALLISGIIILGIGVYTLIGKMMGKDLRTIAQQTTKLAQKGLTDEVTGLVGNARTLIEALNDMVKTTAGIGILLMMLGFVLMGAAYALVLHIK